ncbi:hypothetical protein ACTQV6_03285 [Holdemanella porci]|uniref:hypothetical protein n=1 Tax=Holdemanella porci TaxID=2652276 RepID=UPI003F8DA527
MKKENIEFQMNDKYQKNVYSNNSVFYIDNVCDFLKISNPFNFDFKKLMKGYYLTHNKWKNKITSEEYDALLDGMPYTNDNEANCINYLKYKCADLNLLSLCKLFECDGSNGSCDLSIDIYNRLWGFTSNIEKNAKFGIRLGPDTMCTVTKTIDELFRENQKISIRQIYNEIVENENTEKTQKLNDIFGEIFVNFSTLGNFVLVPFKFNKARFLLTNDFWDLSLALLELNEDKELDGILSKCDWNQETFTKYINLMFLWDFIEIKNKQYHTILFVKDKDYLFEDISEKYDEIKRYFKIMNNIIKRRSLFMTLMLRLSMIDNSVLMKNQEKVELSKFSSLYEEIVSNVFFNKNGTNKIYKGYKEVFDAIQSCLENNLGLDNSDVIDFVKKVEEEIERIKL